MEVVDEMIEEANADWEAIQTDDEALEDRPLPLIRLKVEYSAPEGGLFECENPQRFSNRFVGKVANTNDVVYFYRKKSSQRTSTSFAKRLAKQCQATNTKIGRQNQCYKSHRSSRGTWRWQ
jgi:double-strand break repair protein MRE11